MALSSRILLKTYIHVVDFKDPTKTAVINYDKPIGDGNPYTEEDIINHVQKLKDAIHGFIPNASISWTLTYDGVDKYYTLGILIYPPEDKDEK